jgi:hypothetical protein
MKYAFGILLLVACASAMSWEAFVKIPWEEKMVLQNEQLRLISEGRLVNPALNSSTAKRMFDHSDALVQSFSKFYPRQRH